MALKKLLLSVKYKNCQAAGSYTRGLPSKIRLLIPGCSARHLAETFSNKNIFTFGSSLPPPLVKSWLRVSTKKNFLLYRPAVVAFLEATQEC